MLMLRIPPGEFDLGQVSGPTVGANELKRKFSPTLIQRPAFLSAHEVTIDLFRQLLNDPDYPTADKPNAPFAFDSVVLSSDQMPAVGVSWSDAVLFCNWLSVREGRTPCYRHAEKRFVPHTNRFWRNWTCDFSANGYRLPTEAEWEYCCRAGTTNRFSFGDDVRYLHLFGVYAAQTPQPVGSKFPNPWGFFDMHGNAYEWCWDWHAAYPTEIRTDPTGPEDGQAKVMRGGCWSFPDGNWAHSTRRNFHDMLDYRDRNIGFRVACAP
jgi:formylglycine-generating enzyme required for sulfatase activity